MVNRTMKAGELIDTYVKDEKRNSEILIDSDTE
jgi:hypothetical protein